MATRNPNGPEWAVSPAAWRSKIKYDSWADPVHKKDAIAIHHGGNNDYAAGRQPYSTEAEMAQLRAWERYHLSKKWRGLAYGYGVGQSGTAYRIRGWNNYGAHLGDVDGDGVSNNQEIIPVILIMSGKLHTPSPEMMVTIHRMRGYFEATEETALWLNGHQEIQTQKTSCPGPNNMAWIREHRISAPAGGAPAPPVAPAVTPTDDWLSWVKEEQDNLNRAGFGTLVVDGVNGPRTKHARLQRDLAAAAKGVPFGVPIEIKELS